MGGVFKKLLRFFQAEDGVDYLRRSRLLVIIVLAALAWIALALIVMGIVSFVSYLT